MSTITIDFNDDPKIIRMLGAVAIDVANDITGDDKDVTYIDEKPLIIIEEKFNDAPDPVDPPAHTDTQVQVDASGLPWDERINAGTRGQKADGTWKIRRGVDKELVKTVQAELAAAINPPELPLGEDPKPEPTSTVDPAAKAAFGKTEEPGKPLPLQTDLQWPEFMNRLNQGLMNGTVEPVHLNEMLANNDLASIAMLSVRPDLLPHFVKELGI